MNKKFLNTTLPTCKIGTYGAQREFGTKLANRKYCFPLCPLRFYFTFWKRSFKKMLFIILFYFGNSPPHHFVANYMLQSIPPPPKKAAKGQVHDSTSTLAVVSKYVTDNSHSCFFSQDLTFSSSNGK